MKKEPIRAKDKKLCDRALLARWLYSAADEKGDASEPGALLVAGVRLSCVHMAGVVDESNKSDPAPTPRTSKPAALEPESAILDVLDTNPFSQANKKNNDKRDRLLWNRVWALVSSNVLCVTNTFVCYSHLN